MGQNIWPVLQNSSKICGCGGEVIIPVGESTFDALPNDNAVNCLRKIYVSICQLQQLSAKSEKSFSTVGDSQSA